MAVRFHELDSDLLFDPNNNELRPLFSGEDGGPNVYGATYCLLTYAFFLQRMLQHDAQGVPAVRFVGGVPMLSGLSMVRAPWNDENVWKHTQIPEDVLRIFLVRALTMLATLRARKTHRYAHSLELHEKNRSEFSIATGIADLADDIIPRKERMLGWRSIRKRLVLTVLRMEDNLSKPPAGSALLGQGPCRWCTRPCSHTIVGQATAYGAFHFCSKSCWEECWQCANAAYDGNYHTHTFVGIYAILDPLTEPLRVRNQVRTQLMTDPGTGYHDPLPGLN